MYPCPRADMPTLQTVYQYLNPCRPVTAEMYVIASEYVQLASPLGRSAKAVTVLAGCASRGDRTAQLSLAHRSRAAWIKPAGRSAAPSASSSSKL